MAYPEWPATVNRVPLLDSWSKPDPYMDPRVTDMEGGNKRMLTRPGDDVFRITFNLLMTREVFALFEDFVLTDLGRGTSRFVTEIWNGSSMVEAVVQFASKYQTSTTHPMVTVGLDLFVFPRLVP